MRGQLDIVNMIMSPILNIFNLQKCILQHCEDASCTSLGTFVGLGKEKHHKDIKKGKAGKSLNISTSMVSDSPASGNISCFSCFIV